MMILKTISEISFFSLISSADEKSNSFVKRKASRKHESVNREMWCWTFAHRDGNILCEQAKKCSRNSQRASADTESKKKMRNKKLSAENII